MAGESPSILTPPQIMARGEAAEKIVEWVIARWKAHPRHAKEAREFPARCAEKRKQQLDRGWTEERQFKQTLVIPSYVMLMCGRIFKDPSWWRHDEDALNALLRLMPCCRMDADIGWKSSALCAGDRTME